MLQNNLPKIIVISGAESTGKSVLTQQLAKHYNAPSYPEFARKYISGLNRKYTFNDLEIIAKKQINQYNEAVISEHDFIFFDTWLIITKVWFEVVYNSCPGWITEKIRTAKIFGFILNDIDIPWEPDPLRENGGKRRKILHNIYIKNLDEFNFRYCLNFGLGSDRLNNAIKLIENNFR
jgi:nicotinamide riboside kinase